MRLQMVAVSVMVKLQADHLNVKTKISVINSTYTPASWRVVTLAKQPWRWTEEGFSHS